MDSQARFEERMAALRDAFVGGLPARLEAMRAALDAGDGVAVQHEAHRLAGTGLSYGLGEVTDWGRHVEQLCKERAPAGELRAAIEQFAALIARLRAPFNSAMG